MRILSASVLLGLAACAASTDPKKPAAAEFPKGFVFGTAVAGFQVDMGCPTVPAAECDDQASDWYQWITDARVLAKKQALSFAGDPPSQGPGFYELFPADLARAKNDAKLGSVRLSIEWSRIFPESTKGVTGFEALKAKASANGVAFYHRVFAKMKELGLVPLVTINHYTMPTWVNDGTGCHFDFEHCTARGWLDASTLDEVGKYAAFVGHEYAGEVDLWATENEPLAITLAGYLSPGASRTNPPALSFHAKEAKAVTIAMIKGHARMYDGLKAGDDKDADGDGNNSQVGLVFNMAPVVPADPDKEEDVTAARNTFYLYDQLFLDGTIRGDLDEDANGTHIVHHPELAGRMDYLGINYYTRITVAGTTGPVLPEFSNLLTIDLLSPKTSFDEDYARGIYEMVMYVKDRYRLPMYITENGKSAKAGGDGSDQQRFFAEHLQWLKRAIDEGADVRGYYWWTLMDNYEWNHGMHEFHMGLWAVDPDRQDKPRTRRAMVDTYAAVATGHQLPAELVAKYPIPK